jgi:hypothetical protein
VSIATEIAGLIQVGLARGYNDFSAVHYANNEMSPGVRFRAVYINTIAIEVNKRVPRLPAQIWGALIAVVMENRIEPEPVQEPAGQALPPWAWGIIGFVGIVLITGGLRR